MVAPSIHPTTGGRYTWRLPGETASLEVPAPADVAELPWAWVVAFGVRAPLAEPAHNPPAEPRMEPRERWSSSVRRVHDEAVEALRSSTPGSRHDAARDAAMGLCRLESLGDPGATRALDSVGEHFRAAVTRPGENQRTLEGVGRPTPVVSCPETSVFASTEARRHGHPVRSRPRSCLGSCATVHERIRTSRGSSCAVLRSALWRWVHERRA